MPEPLDVLEVKLLAEGIWKKFSMWRSRNIVRDELRFRELGTEIKGISQKLEDLSPAANAHGTRYVERIMAADMSAETSSRSADDTAVRSARRVEDYHNWHIQELKKQRTAGILMPLRRAVDDTTFKGCGWIRTGFKPHIKRKLMEALDLDNEEEGPDTDELTERVRAVFSEGFDEDPFLDECPELDTVAFEYDRSIVVEKGRRSVSELLRLYEHLGYDTEAGFHWLTSETMSSFNTTRWSEDEANYWHVETEDYIYDLVEVPTRENDEPFMLSVIPNIIGRPWYAMFAGRVTNNSDISKRYLPLINDVYPIVHKLNVTQTLIQSGALNTGRPMYQEVADSAKGMTLPEVLSQPLEQRPVLAFDPSEEVLQKPKKGHHWEVVPVPDMSWVVEANRESRQELREYGFPVSLSPEVATSGTAESGVQGMQQIEISVNYLNPATESVALGLQELFAIRADALKELDVSITIPVTPQGGDNRVREMMRIEPSDFKGVDTSVSLDAIPASALLAVRQSDLELVQAKMMSKTDFFMKHYKDYMTALKRVFLDEGKMLMEQEMLKLVQQFAQQQGPALMAQAAADQQIPLPIPGLANQSGGPAPGDQGRQARPPVPMPGVGMSPTPVDQNPMQTAGTAQQVGVP